MADEGDHLADAVQQGAPFNGGKDAQGNANDNGEEEGRHTQLEGGGEPFDDDLHRGASLFDGLAELAAEGVAEEDTVLLVIGTVQFQGFGEPFLVRLGGVVVEVDAPGVTGGPAHDEDD